MEGRPPGRLITMPNVPVTGLSGLGAALADAGADYLGRTRQLEDEKRRRGYQLEDTQSARAYQDSVRREERVGRIEDQQTLDRQHARQVLITTLQTEGLLAPGKENDEQAVAAAYAEAQRRGLDKLYQELLSTPGPDGKPLLTQADLGNPARVQAAKDALGAIKADRMKFQLGQQDNAQATADSLQQQLTAVRAKSAEIAGRIDAPVRQFGPADREVLTLASQMAEQAKPGSGRNREAITAMVPVAQKQLNDQSLIQHAQEVQSATRELESLRYNEAQLTNALRETLQTFKVAPSRASNAATLQSPTAAAPAGAPKPATADQMTAAMDAVFGKAAPAQGATPAPGAAMLANPTNDPLISQENTRREGDAWQKNLADPFNAAMDKVDRIKAEINRVRAGLPPPNAPAVTFGLPNANDIYNNPTVKANSLSQLLVELDAAQKEAEQARRAMLGVPAVPKPVSAPAATPGAMLSSPAPISAPPPSPPQWWKTGAPAPAGVN